MRWAITNVCRAILALLLCNSLFNEFTTGSVLATERAARGWVIELSEQERKSVLALLRARQFGQLDQRYENLQQQYEEGKINDRDLTLEYQAFYDTAPENLSYLSAWVSTSPKSYPAHLARGIYYRKVGAEKRGTAFVGDTPPANLMQLSNYLKLAHQDLVESLSLARKPIVTLLHLANSSMMRGDKKESYAWLTYANRIDPLNYSVRRRYMLTLSPRWGGSYEQMWQFLKTCQNQHIPEEYLRVFEAAIYLDQANTLRERDQADKALPLYSKAATLLEGIDNSERLEALKGLLYSAKLTDLEKYSRQIDETLRLAPTERQILGYRGWIRFNEGRWGEGLKDYALAAELGDAYSQLQFGKQLYYGVPSILGSNQQQALVWAKKSAEQGYEPAKQFLEEVSKNRPLSEVR